MRSLVLFEGPGILRKASAVVGLHLIQGGLSILLVNWFMLENIDSSTRI